MEPNHQGLGPMKRPRSQLMFRRRFWGREGAGLREPLVPQVLLHLQGLSWTSWYPQVREQYNAIIDHRNNFRWKYSDNHDDAVPLILVHLQDHNDINAMWDQPDDKLENLNYNDEHDKDLSSTIFFRLAIGPDGEVYCRYFMSCPCRYDKIL